MYHGEGGRGRGEKEGEAKDEEASAISRLSPASGALARSPSCCGRPTDLDGGLESISSPVLAPFPNQDSAMRPKKTITVPHLARGESGRVPGFQGVPSARHDWCA